MDIDSKVRELLNVVTQKKKEIADKETITKMKWLTNCTFPFGDSRPNRNIQTANQEQVLEVARTLTMHEFFDTAAKTKLGMSLDVVSVYAGFNVTSWYTDLQKRLAVISLNEEKRKLDDLEAKLNTLVSPEQRRAMELEAVMKELGQ
ncbi:hypothetical protein [Synechococcus phage BUCT-ZZ01]|nr:hypothetical protein [Synechococcus phage BUCT-ZZ01]